MQLNGKYLCINNCKFSVNIIGSSSDCSNRFPNILVACFSINFAMCCNCYMFYWCQVSVIFNLP